VGIYNSAALCGAEQSSRRVEDQTRQGIAAIAGETIEAVQDSFLSGCVHHKHHSPVVNAAEVGGSVEIAGRVPNHTAFRSSAVHPAAKAVEHFFLSG
jgi:hypothetical protein